VVPGLLPGVDSRYRDIIPLPVCISVFLEGLDIMLDFNQMTHEELDHDNTPSTALQVFPEIYYTDLTVREHQFS
jgi:hypothetical protein